MISVYCSSKTLGDWERSVSFEPRVGRVSPRQPVLAKRGRAQKHERKLRAARYDYEIRAAQPRCAFLGSQPTVIASAFVRAAHPLFEHESVKLQKIVDVRRPSSMQGPSRRAQHCRSLVLNRSPIIFKNLQIKSKSVKEGMNRRIFSC